MATRNVDNALLVQENADIKDKQPNVDLKRQFAGDESCLKIVKEQEGSREQVESENSGKAVENVNEIGYEHVEKCIESESDEELYEIKDQSSTGKSGIPCVLEQTGGSEYGSDCLENEIVSHIKILNENDAVKDSTCEEMTEEKIDAEVRKSEKKVIDADSKSEMDRLNACCQNGENDEVEGEKRADGKDGPAKVNSKWCDKPERFINSFVRRVKVAYKIYRGCTENFFFQTVFVLTIVFQRNNPEFFHIGNPILNQFYAEMIQTPHSGFQENSVFTVLENSSAPEAISIFLPEPNLPRTTDNIRPMNIVNANTLGITLRPANTGSSDTSQLRVDSSQCIQHTGTSSGGHQSNDEVQRSSEFISISSSPLTATVREGENDSQQVQRCTRTNDIPALPYTDELALDEANTNRKITEPVRDNLINRGQSRQSVDGSPSSATTNLRDRNIPTVGTYSLERIPEYASHLSNSVSEQPSQQISDDMVFGEERMSNELARARTFNDRWPHRHLNPGDMARAGFFFTGEEDMTRCFDCDIGLGQWETDDSPFTEHRRLSPECQYIQSLCQNDPQLFGASGQVGTGDAASGGQQNDIQGLGHRRTIYRQMSRENSGRLVPHCEHGDNDSTIYSELLQAQSCESEHTGIQESGSNTGLTMFAVTENSRTLQDSPNLDSANVNELIGTDQTFDAIDYNMDFYRRSQEVRMVLSEGYSQREVDIAVESLLNEDGIITVDALKYKLQYLGFTQKH